jgi:hypothetical protein
MPRRTFFIATGLVLMIAALSACGMPALGAAPTGLRVAQTGPSTIFIAAPADDTTPSAADISAIKSVIQKGNQEEVQAIATQDPTLLQDTSTPSYYQEMVQTVNDLLDSGVTAIRLDNLDWGPITLQNATTAQATTSETWSTTLDDGSTSRETDTNVYTLVLVNGTWKVQDDQHPDQTDPQQSPTIPGGKSASATNAPIPSGA